MTREKLNWRSFVDDETIVAKWKPAGTPSFYIIDPKGVIRYKWAGAPAGEAIDVALEMLLDEMENAAKPPPK